MPRSQRKAFKPRVVKKDDMDEQTKDEKQYLAPELFIKLQESKAKQLKLKEQGLNNDKDKNKNRIEVINPSRISIVHSSSNLVV